MSKSTKNGDIHELISPVDSDGKLCGFTEGYEDFPFLYYLVKAYPDQAIFQDSALEIVSQEQMRVLQDGQSFTLKWSPVCIMKCPHEIDSAIICKPTNTITEEDCAKE